MVLLKCCAQHASKFGKQQAPQDWKRSVFIPVPTKGNAKECSNYCTIALISHASKVMLKILQARLPQYMNRELLDVQAGFRKGRGTRDQIANICWIIKKENASVNHKKVKKQLLISVSTRNIYFHIFLYVSYKFSVPSLCAHWYYEMDKLVLEKAEEPEIK